MRLVLACVLLWIGSSAAVLPVLTHVHSKFEYEHSFKGPYLTNSKGDVPFWSHGGSEPLAIGYIYITPETFTLSPALSLLPGCIPSDDQVRVCPSIKSRRGWIWTKSSFSSSHWMVDLSVRVTGRLKTGADGMVGGASLSLSPLTLSLQAIWFTSAPGSEGMAFGNVEIWQGLAVVLDSFDNDGLVRFPIITKTTVVMVMCYSTTTRRSWRLLMMGCSDLTTAGENGGVREEVMKVTIATELAMRLGLA